MKKNSGSALTSVIVIFLIVTMISVPLISMVVYNYRMREYDSAIKEAEYKNEVIMDRVATIIKNKVVAAISEAKNTAADDISKINDALVTAYSTAYDNAYDSAYDTAIYDEAGNISNLDDVNNQIKDNLKENLKSSLGDYEGVSKDEIVGILAIDESEDVSTAKINEELLGILCNNIFQNRYENILLEKSINGLFEAIYNDDEYSGIATNRLYGEQELKKDENNKVLSSSSRVVIKYEKHEGSFSKTYNKFDSDTNNSYEHEATFSVEDKLEIGIESKYKLTEDVPTSTLSATFIIGVPNFNAISSVEQQTIALSNPTLDYGLIVGETLTLNGTTQVDGNILARANGIKEGGASSGIVINSGGDLVSIAKKASGMFVPGDGRIATAGDIIMDSDTTLTTGTNPIYYRNLYLGVPDATPKTSGEIKVQFNGDVLAKDDLEVNFDSDVKVSQTDGSYFGFNDTNDDGPDSSSAIVINSSETSKVTIGLKNLYLAGRAFIDGVRSTNRVDKNNKNMIYKTGESISVKGNYIAYQTPLVGTGDYDSDGDSGDFDVNNVKFSPYFMTGRKSGIDNETNLTINLVDNFIPEISYENFDTLYKWQYFKEFASANNASINKPNISIDSVKYMEGIGINGGNLVDKVTNTTEQATMINKGKRFDEFTEYFGYYPADETKRKGTVKDWIKFDSDTKKVQEGNFFTYISKASAGDKTLAWGTSTTGADIDIVAPNTSGINGIIIHDGNLTITSSCDATIPFNGMIIVTGNLTINSDVSIIFDKDTTSNIIIQNYLGGGYTYPNGSEEGTLEEGDLFDSFTYDDSGTTYVAIDIGLGETNMIDINDLVGITDWKKHRYIGI